LILASIALGGALGSVLRYLVQTHSVNWFGSSFPYGTLLVNVAGSLMIGFLSYTLVERLNAPEELRLAILVGFLGGFTTFSTFSLETLTLIQQGSILGAFINVFLSVGLCLLACILGLSLARIV